MKLGLCILILVTATLILSAQDTRIDTLQTLNSFGFMGEFCYLDYQGDYEDMLQYINNLYAGGNQTLPQDFNCSLYSGIGDPQNLFFGRNMDNPELDVLVARYSPPGQYKNIALTRLNDVGIPTGSDYSALSQLQMERLLWAPYFAADGLNETGLSTGLAFVPSVTYEPDPDKDTIFITMLCRRILDGAATCQEALDIANSYNVFDLSQNVVSHHLLVTDASGESIILEFVEDCFVAIPTDVNWQVLTNTAIYENTLEYLFGQCWRYQLLYETLEEQNGIIEDWREAMDIVALPTWHSGTQGTQWSTVADINETLLYVSIDRDFNNIARVDVETFEFLNYGNLYISEPDIFDEDNDGLFETGELVLAYLTVSADFPTPGLYATLTDPDGQVTLTSGEFDYGDLQPGMEVANIISPFLIEIPEDLQPGIVTIDVLFTTSYGRTYEDSFEFEVVESNGTDDIPAPPVTMLSNYPNPFNPETVICFSVPEKGMTSLEIFNCRGQRVRSLVHDVRTEGEYRVVWSGTDDRGASLSSGVYLCRLQTGDKSMTRKLMLMK